MYPISRSLDVTERPSRKQRNRAVISCIPCHRSKIKCNRQLPCQTCVVLGRPQQCDYQQHSSCRENQPASYGGRVLQKDSESFRSLVAVSRAIEVERAVHSHELMGGPIPLAQANEGALGSLIGLFAPRQGGKRPFIELLANESQSPTTSPMLLVALHAVSTAMCGKLIQHPEMHIRGSRLYGAAIRQLQACLNSERATEPVVMYVMLLMSLHQIIIFHNFNDGRSLNAHMRASARIVELRGPERHVHGLEHQFFRRHRMQMLLIGMIDRKPSFLAEERWKIIPFSHNYPSKDINELLQDILVEFPGLLAAVDNLRKKSYTTLTRMQKVAELVQAVRRLTFALEKWKRDWILTYPSIFIRLLTQSPGLTTLISICSQIEPYDDLLMESMNSYCAAHLTLTRISRTMIEKSSLLGSILSPPYELQELVDAIIELSTRLLCSNSVTVESVIITTYPLRVALIIMEEIKLHHYEKVQGLVEKANNVFKSRFKVSYVQTTIAHPGFDYRV